jgi:hypothetical protein
MPKELKFKDAVGTADKDAVGTADKDAVGTADSWKTRLGMSLESCMRRYELKRNYAVGTAEP